MPEKKVDFEKSMEKLEKIVEELESGQFSLEQSLAKFEEGMKLGKTCRDVLDKAEVRVKRLVENARGELEEQDVDDSDD